MEIVLTINGKQVKATIDDEDLEKINKKTKKTGYEKSFSVRRFLLPID